MKNRELWMKARGMDVELPRGDLEDGIIPRHRRTV